jgi:PKD repeat protein
MKDNNLSPSKKRWYRRPRFHIDGLLLTFLIAGSLLVFASANFGLRRGDQQWLPAVNPVSQVLADYSENRANTLMVARVDPEIVEAVKAQIQIEENTRTVAPAVAVPQPPPALAVNAPLTPTNPLSNLELIPNLSALTVGAGGPYQGDEGSAIPVAVGSLGSLINSALGTVSYRWDLDNDGLYDDALGSATSVVFNDEGDYSISVQASDVLGRIAVDQTTVRVRNVPPTIEIGPERYANEATEISFSASVSDPGQDILLYEWSFGDGSAKVNDTVRPQHTYDDDGDYVVYLRVKDNDGGVAEDYLLVHVGNLPPQVDAGLNKSVNEGEPVALRGSATDPSDEDSLTYAWDFDYDGISFTPDAIGRTATHIYADGPATAVAALRVRDEDGGESIDTVNVTVNNVAPVFASVTSSGPVGEGLPITVVVEAVDPGNDTLAYAFDWTNDGTFEVTEQSTILSNTWYNDGDFTVGIRVFDEDRGEAFTTTVVSTFNLTPTAVATVANTTFLEGAEIAFDSSYSSDPGLNDPLTYLWDFGDGSGEESLDSTHAYAENGVYTATLIVLDEDGAADSDTVTVEILNANPTASAGLDIEVDEGVDVLLSFDGNGTDPGADGLSYAWDLDYDGSNFAEDAAGASVTKLHPVLDGPFEYMVALRVRDDDYPYPTAAGGEIGEHIYTLRVIVKNTAPKNVSANGPYLGEPGQPIRLAAAQATDVPGDTVSYEWDLDYDGTSFESDAAGQTVEYTWNAPGLYEVALRVADEDGAERLDVTLVNINLPPIAVAGGPYGGPEGALLTFNGSGSSDPDNDSLTYAWNFGDGSPATTGITATHAFPDNGIYTTTLTVVDQDGAADSSLATVTVANADPIADAGPDRVTDEGLSLNLVASASSDPGYGDTLSYAWDFDYDGLNFDEDASGGSVSVTYPDGPVTYTVALRVRDDDYPYTAGGNIGEDLDTLTVAVNNVPPVVNAGGPYQASEGEPINLAGTGLDAPLDSLTYDWDLNYNGLIFTPDLIGQTVTHVWSTPGIYEIAFRATDKDGGLGVATAQVNINAIPIADAGDSYSGNEGSPITLTGSGLDADDDTLSFAWDLDNDGSFETPGQVVTHVWSDEGTYPVVLQVDDGRGGLATAQATVSVINVAPSVNAGPDQTVLEGTSISLSGLATDPGADVLGYEWDFDYDGVTFNVTETGQSVSPTFADGPASLTVALRVNDGDGGVSLDTAVIIVDNGPPTAAAGGPYLATISVPITLAGTGVDVPEDTLTYSWDLDNDGVFETPGQSVPFVNTVAGTYTVVLQVDDNEGGVATDTTTVEVIN